MKKLMKIIIGVIFFMITLMGITSCIPQVTPEGKLVFAAYPTEILNSTNVTIMFLVTDDVSLKMNYSLYFDNTLKSAGIIANNTLINVTAILNPEIHQRTVGLVVFDEAGNMAEHNITVNLTDMRAPVIQYIKIYAN